MAQITIDMSGERFGAQVSIAHLAQHSFHSVTSDDVNIYQVDQILTREWKWDIETVEMEYLTGVTAIFKDGSKLNVAAWADCCREGDEDHGRCYWCGGRGEGGRA